MTLFEEYKKACGNGDVEEIERLTIKGLKVREPHIVADTVETYFAILDESGDLEMAGEIKGMLKMVGLEDLLN